MAVLRAAHRRGDDELTNDTVVLANGKEGSALQLTAASPDAVVVRLHKGGPDGGEKSTETLAVVEVKSTTCFMLQHAAGAPLRRSCSTLPARHFCLAVQSSGLAVGCVCGLPRPQRSSG